MTPEQFSNWLPPASLAVSLVAGFVVLMVSVRTGWIERAVKWATVGFGGIGAAMVLVPTGKQIAVQYDDFKTTISQLQNEKANLVAENAKLNSQISLVSLLGQDDKKTAKDAIAQIVKVKSEVPWADFLPSNPNSFAVAVSPDNPEFTSTVAKSLNVPESDVTKAFKDTGFTVLKASKNSGDLTNVPASELWVTPK
jgi:hypothetical protein